MFGKANKNMCVSDHMGLQNRVGRSGFFLQYFVIVLRARDFRQILT